MSKGKPVPPTQAQIDAEIRQILRERYSADLDTSSERERKVLEELNAYWKKHKKSPKIKDLAASLGIKYSTVFTVLQRMRDENPPRVLYSEGVWVPR